MNAKNADPAWVTVAGDGICPVPLSAIVEIWLRDGDLNAGIAGQWHGKLDAFNSYKHNGGACDIVKLRLITFTEE